jgi:hypothetical protein
MKINWQREFAILLNRNGDELSVFEKKLYKIVEKLGRGHDETLRICAELIPSLLILLIKNNVEGSNPEALALGYAKMMLLPNDNFWKDYVVQNKIVDLVHCKPEDEDGYATDFFVDSDPLQDIPLNEVEFNEKKLRLNLKNRLPGIPPRYYERWILEARLYHMQKKEAVQEMEMLAGYVRRAMMADTERYDPFRFIQNIEDHETAKYKNITHFIKAHPEHSEAGLRKAHNEMKAYAKDWVLGLYDKFCKQ